MSITIPLVLMAIPIFDSSMALVRRKLTGRSLFSVDRGHLHHHLMRRGFHDRALVGIITLFSFLTASGAVAGVLLGSDWISLATMTFSIGALVVFKLFGFAELKLMYKRLEGYCTSLFVRPDRVDSFVHQESVHLQGTRNWDVIWQTLVEFAEKHGLSRIQMNLDMPWLHEGYHAEWQKADLPEVSRRWSLKFPLIIQGESYGGLEFIGKQQEGESLLVLAQLTELLDAIHSQLEAFRYELEENRSSQSGADEETAYGSKVAMTAEKTGFLPNISGAVTSGVTEAVEIP